MKPQLLDFLFKVHTSESKIEHVPLILFNSQMQPVTPLGTPEKLAGKKFKLPVSFIYGDNDWVQIIEEDIADVILKKNPFYMDPDQKSNKNKKAEDMLNGLRNSIRQSVDERMGGSTPPAAKGLKQSRVHIIPTSDHNMHMDNPEALSNAIINDIYGLELSLQPNIYIKNEKDDENDAEVI